MRVRLVSGQEGVSQARSSLSVFGDTDFDATPVPGKDKGKLGMNWISQEGFLEEMASKQRSRPGRGGGEQSRRENRTCRGVRLTLLCSGRWTRSHEAGVCSLGLRVRGCG